MERGRKSRSGCPRLGLEAGAQCSAALLCVGSGLTPQAPSPARLPCAGVRAVSAVLLSPREGEPVFLVPRRLTPGSGTVRGIAGFLGKLSRPCHLTPGSPGPRRPEPGLGVRGRPPWVRDCPFAVLFPRLWRYPGILASPPSRAPHVSGGSCADLAAFPGQIVPTTGRTVALGLGCGSQALSPAPSSPSSTGGHAPGPSRHSRVPLCCGHGRRPWDPGCHRPWRVPADWAQALLALGLRQGSRVPGRACRSQLSREPGRWAAPTRAGAIAGRVGPGSHGETSE